MKKEDIISTIDLGIAKNRGLPARVFYAEGFSAENLPKLFRVIRRGSKRWTGVRACCPSSDAVRNAKISLDEEVQAAQGEYPDFTVVRSGWKEGYHACHNHTGSIPDRKRSCWGVVSFECYIDFKRTSTVDRFLERLKDDLNQEVQ